MKERFLGMLLIGAGLLFGFLQGFGLLTLILVAIGLLLYFRKTVKVE